MSRESESGEATISFGSANLNWKGAGSKLVQVFCTPWAFLVMVSRFCHVTHLTVIGLYGACSVTMEGAIRRARLQVVRLGEPRSGLMVKPGSG